MEIRLKPLPFVGAARLRENRPPLQTLYCPLSAKAPRRRSCVQCNKKTGALSGARQSKGNLLQIWFHLACSTATVSRQMAISSFVGMTHAATREASVEIFTLLPRCLFFSASSSMPR